MILPRNEQNVPKFAMFLLLSCLVGCSQPKGPATTNTASSQFKNLTEKTAFLEQYFTPKRTYGQLDFKIDYFNGGSGGVPSPSEWDIRIIAQVPADELDAWIDGLEIADEHKLDVSWVQEIETKIDTANIKQWYLDGSVTVGIDRENRVIAYRNVVR